MERAARSITGDRTRRNSGRPPFRYFIGHRLALWFEIVYLLCLPIAVWFFYRFSTFNNNDGLIDPWVYFGYVHNFRDLIDRYGLPYYSVRFGFIFPLIALAKVFGALHGYLVFVYLMYLLAGVPLYLLFRKRFSVHAAILSYAILVSSVWFARTVLWTYPDASAVPYLLAATGLVFLEPKYRRLGDFMIGLLLALAAGSNAFALLNGGLTGVAYAIYYKKTFWRRLREDVPWIAAGFLLITIGSMVGYLVCCREMNYFNSTLNQVKSTIGGEASRYQVPLAVLLEFYYLYLLPFLVLSVIPLLRKMKGRDLLLCVAAVSYLGVAIIFFVFFRFVVQMALLEYFNYYSFLLVPGILLIALVPVILARESTSEFYNLNISLVAFLVPPIGMVYGSSVIVTELSVVWISLSFVVTLLLIRLAVQFSKVTCVAVVFFALSILLSLISTVSKSPAIRGDPLHVYARMYGVADEVGLARYRLGLKFIMSMPKFKDDGRPVYFWYANADKLANSLQSTYLWGYSRVMDSNQGTQGLPSMDGFNVDLLRKRSALVLFDRKEKIVDEGIDKLRNWGVRFAVQHTREICEEKICYTIALLDVNGVGEKLSKAEESKSIAP